MSDIQYIVWVTDAVIYIGFTFCTIYRQFNRCVIHLHNQQDCANEIQTSIDDVHPTDTASFT